MSSWPTGDVAEHSVFRTAVVFATSPLEITLDGGTTSVPASRLASYSSPTVGDNVRVERTDTDYLIHGQIA